MNSIVFDTLAFANKLKAAGFTEQQAEAITSLQVATSDHTADRIKHDYHLDELALKRDLKELETALRRDMGVMEAGLKRELAELEVNLSHKIELLKADTGRNIAECKADLTRWIISAGVLQTSIIIAVLMKVAKLL